MYGMVSANLENCAGQRKYTFHEKSAVRTRSAIFHWFSGDTAPYKKYVSTGVGSPFPPCTLYICTYTAQRTRVRSCEPVRNILCSHQEHHTRIATTHTHGWFFWQAALFEHTLPDAWAWGWNHAKKSTAASVVAEPSLVRFLSIPLFHLWVWQCESSIGLNGASSGA